MTSLYVVMIQCPGRAVPVENIQKTVDAAKDWARFSPFIWIVATELSANDWYMRIRSVLDPTDNIVVHKLDTTERAGWATKPIIDFFNRDHSERPGL